MAKGKRQLVQGRRLYTYCHGPAWLARFCVLGLSLVLPVGGAGSQVPAVTVLPSISPSPAGPDGRWLLLYLTCSAPRLCLTEVWLCLWISTLKSFYTGSRVAMSPETSSDSWLLGSSQWSLLVTTWTISILMGTIFSSIRSAL